MVLSSSLGWFGLSVIRMQTVDLVHSVMVRNGRVNQDLGGLSMLPTSALNGSDIMAE